MTNAKKKKKKKTSFTNHIIDFLPKQTTSKDINVKNKISTSGQRTFFIIILLIFVSIIIRLFYIQFIQDDYLKKMAYSQQTSSETITATRGNIYDANRYTFSY